MGYSLLNPNRPFELSLQVDEDADDSDKTLSVPTGSIWQVLWVWVELASTATVGDRQMQIDFRDDSDDVIAEVRAGAVQAASLTRKYLFAPGNADLAAFRDTDYLMTPIPPTLFLPAGFDIRIYDNNAVDAAADDMVVQAMMAVQVI